MNSQAAVINNKDLTKGLTKKYGFFKRHGEVLGLIIVTFIAFVFCMGIIALCAFDEQMSQFFANNYPQIYKIAKTAGNILLYALGSICGFGYFWIMGMIFGLINEEINFKNALIILCFPITIFWYAIVARKNIQRQYYIPLTIEELKIKNITTIKEYFEFIDSLCTYEIWGEPYSYYLDKDIRSNLSEHLSECFDIKGLSKKTYTTIINRNMFDVEEVKDWLESGKASKRSFDKYKTDEMTLEEIKEYVTHLIELKNADESNVDEFLNSKIKEN